MGASRSVAAKCKVAAGTEEGVFASGDCES